MALRLRTRALAVIVLIAVVLVVLVSLRRSTTPTSEPPTQPDPATPQPLETFDATQRARAEQLSAAYASSLVGHHPELAGLTVTDLYPVYDEAAALPVGAMARLTLPAVVRAVTMNLVRSRHGRPEQIESAITNLHGLDVIVLFSTGQIADVGVTPEADDALDPAAATRVRTIDPGQHRDPDFGADE